MAIGNNKKNGEEKAQPEKLYTQQDVDVMRKKIEDRSESTHQTHDHNLVAGMVRKSNRILTTITSHKFPFDFFPDTLNIEEKRITIVMRKFFFFSQMHSIDIANISNIFINTSPFFAQLVIVSNTFTENEIRIPNLRQNDATFARRIIEGLRSFRDHNIDTSNYAKEELIAKLLELSTTEMVT